MPRLAVLSVLSAASSPCPDLNLIHYKKSKLNPAISNSKTENKKTAS
ncbi:hypothetical protein NEIELOOT_01523 [Neisseria elongata subsp. glycolytica ATCC 29315]|uniref:Uncharacterized protein n=1 Tax=Neisseria elongata subsp. glycolytica ATCC 29315 TaxID=546263 RepID=D4DR30_NEIEG|nr:hypothetical protein NEIELOOT_01523 [Neisseria elongata subsp. glycolytica ATCC 29315]